MSLAQLQSNRLRNTHRLAGVGDAQGAVEKLQEELKQAMADVLKKHDLKLRDLNINLSLSAGADPYGGGRKSPAGWLTASLDVA
jgi:hypothetical protein